MQTLLYDLFNLLFVPRHRYPDSYSQLRARVTLAFSVFVALLCVFILIVVALLSSVIVQTDNVLALAFGGLIFQVFLISLVHTGQGNAASLGVFGFSVIASTVLFLIIGVEPGPVLAASIGTFYAGMVWAWWALAPIYGYFLAILIVTSLLVGQGILVPMGGTPLEGPFVLRVVGAIGLYTLLTGVSAIAALEMRRLLGFGGRMMTQLRAVYEIAENTTTSGTLSELLTRTVNYLRDRFGFYQVQLFLSDHETRYATLAASTGDLGETLMQRGYRIAVGAQSAVGQALQTGEPVSISNAPGSADFDPAAQGRELLRDTRSALVLPLIVGERVIGALDVQSTRLNAFVSEEVERLRLLAAQVGVIVHNARQIEEARVGLDDTRRLLLETEVSLRDAQRLNQRLTKEAWEDYLRARNTEIIGYTLAENRIFRDSSWSEGLQHAAGKRRPHIGQPDPSRYLIAVPIELRGRTIGAIEVEMQGTVRQAELLDVLNSVAQRLALSIDNARLFEQAQELAQRELEVNAISARMQGMNDIEELAKTALTELSRALGASQAVIRLGTPADTITPGSTDVNGKEG